MSKGNRIKGKFNPVLNCRQASTSRYMSLEQRKEGLTERHQPVKSKRSSPKMTKTMRKMMSRITKQGNDTQHPLSRRASAHEIGAAKIMGFISSVVLTPEQVTV